MKIIEGDWYIEQESRFRGYFAHVNTKADFENFLSQIKQIHETAHHHVWAYRIEAPQLNMLGDREIMEKSSNDGEPSNTGRTVLEILSKKRFVNGRNIEFANCAVVIVRYFGGILLGAENVPKAFGRTTLVLLDKVIALMLKHNCRCIKARGQHMSLIE